MDLTHLKTFTTTLVKNSSGEFVNAMIKGPAVAITKNNRVIAVGLPIEEYERFLAIEAEVARLKLQVSQGVREYD